MEAQCAPPSLNPKRRGIGQHVANGLVVAADVVYHREEQVPVLGLAKTAKIFLTDRTLKAARPAAKAYDMHDAVVPGMAFSVLPSGFKRFVLVARFPGSRNPTRRALGQYGQLTLEAARAKARQWLELIARGIDPAEEVERQQRKQEARRAITFKSVAEDFIRVEVHGPGGEKRPRHRSANKTVTALREILVPLFGHRPITELTATEILEPIELIGQIGTDRAMVRLGIRKALHRPGRKSLPAPAQARVLFALCQMVLRWASEPDAHYGLDRSPLDRVRKSRRFGRTESRGHTFNDEELAALQIAIARLAPPHRQAYQVLLYSGLRLNEVMRARWSEIESDVWIIGPERMKGRNGEAKPHAVPITSALRKVFDGTPRGERGDFVFSCTGGATPIVAQGSSFKERLDQLMLRGLRARARARGEDPDKVTLRPWRNHDIRRTCRSTLSRLGVDLVTAEAVLAHRHAGGPIAATYDVWERVHEKRDALERWANFLAGLLRPRPVQADEQVVA
jgi:integrase